MGNLIVWILSKLFPPRLDTTLTHEELHLTLDFYRRDSRRKPFVWSSIGNVMEHSAKPKPSVREWRNREIPIVVSIADRADRIWWKANDAGRKSTEANSFGSGVARVLSW